MPRSLTAFDKVRGEAGLLFYGDDGNRLGTVIQKAPSPTLSAARLNAGFRLSGYFPAITVGLSNDAIISLLIGFLSLLLAGVFHFIGEVWRGL